MTLNEALRIDLTPIDKELINMVKYDKDLSKTSIVTKCVMDIIQSGGKRIRPMMVIVGSRFGGGVKESNLYRLAAVTEFLHVASLIHDDIIDNATMRRNQEAQHVKWGTRSALHVGNYMMARVIELLLMQSEEYEEDVHQLASHVTIHLCQGEYQQWNNRFNFDITLETYITKTDNKTALLMATCLEVGARASRADEEVVEKLRLFGDYLGMAFQIRDDVFDFIQTEQQIGKPVGNDLRNGNVTLPVIYALEDQILAQRIRSLHAASPEEQVNAVIADIIKSDSITKANELSDYYLQQAHNIIEDLKGFDAYQDLKILLSFFSNRKS